MLELHRHFSRIGPGNPDGFPVLGHQIPVPFRKIHGNGTVAKAQKTKRKQQNSKDCRSFSKMHGNPSFRAEKFQMDMLSLYTLQEEEKIIKGTRSPGSFHRPLTVDS